MDTSTMELERPVELTPDVLPEEIAIPLARTAFEAIAQSIEPDDRIVLPISIMPPHPHPGPPGPPPGPHPSPPGPGPYPPLPPNPPFPR